MKVKRIGGALEVDFTDKGNPSVFSATEFVMKKCSEMDWLNKDAHGRPRVKNEFFINKNNKIYLHHRFKDSFMEHMKNRGKSVSIEGDHKATQCTDVAIKLRDGIKLYEEQETALTALLSNCALDTYMLGLKPGGGKTFSSLVFLSRYNRGIVILAKAGYLDQWETEVNKVYVLEEGECESVVGSQALSELARSGKKPKVTLISITTYVLYIKRWMKGDDVIDPWDLMPSLNAESLLIDEADENLVGFYKAMMLNTYKRCMGLSGTFDLSHNPFLKGVLEVMYPSECRYTPPPDEAYRNYLKVSYYHDDPESIVTSVRYRSTYNQNAYEKWIMKRASRKKRLFKMILFYVNASYMKRRKPGDKCLLLFGSVTMCEEVAQYLKERTNVTCFYFRAGMKKSILNDKDIITSTFQKAGRALDIPGLIDGHSFANIGKIETFVQNKGRLRRPTGKFKDSYRKGYMDDGERVFIQYNCIDIPTHKRYQRTRDMHLARSIKTEKSVLYKETI